MLPDQEGLHKNAIFGKAMEGEGEIVCSVPNIWVEMWKYVSPFTDTVWYAQYFQHFPFNFKFLASLG